MAFVAIYFIWGSTYLFVAFAVDELPPFFMAGCRFLIAGLWVVGILSIFRRDLLQFNWIQFRNAAFAGFLFLTLGNGGVTWALQFVDSGFTALLISGHPLVLIIMMWIWDRDPLSFKTYIGIALGMTGIFLLVAQDEIVVSADDTMGMLVIFGCLFVWAYASLFVKKKALPKSYLTNTAVQMIVGGSLLLIFSIFTENLNLDYRQVSTKAYGSVFILIVFGSIIAFTAFNYLLQHVSPEKVATSTYINPIVALFLGYKFNNEIITSQSILAAGILILGVYFINSRKVKGDV